MSPLRSAALALHSLALHTLLLLAAPIWAQTAPAPVSDPATASPATSAASPASPPPGSEGAASQPAPAAAAPRPALNLKVQVVNPEDLLDHNKTLLVPTAYVHLLVEQRTVAARQSGLFSRGNATARSSAHIKVQGLDKAFAQELARLAQDDLMAQLRQAGFTVLGWDDPKVQALLSFAAREPVDSAAGLPTSSEGGQTHWIAAPSDAQRFKPALAGGVFAEFLQGGKSRITDATLILPQYIINAPQSWAETQAGYRSVSAEVNVAPGMNLARASAQWLGAPKSRVMRGAPGVSTTEQLVNATESAGVLVQTADTTPQAANALGGILSALSGAGNIQRSSADYSFTVDRAAYQAGVMNAIRAFNAEVARAAAAARAQ